MNPLNLLRLLREQGEKTIFSLADLELLTGEEPVNVQATLRRLNDSGVADILDGAWVANPFHPPDPEEVAMVLCPPCYLSLEYALNIHLLLGQLAFTRTLVHPGATRTLTVGRPPVRYEYNQIPRRLFFGFQQDARGVSLAVPEKALLDFIYIRHLATGELSAANLGSFLDDLDLSGLNVERLREFASRFGAEGETMLGLITAAAEI